MLHKMPYALGRAEKIKPPEKAILADCEEMRKHWYAFAIAILTAKTPDKAMLYMSVEPQTGRKFKSRKQKRTTMYAEVGCKFYILTKICGMTAANAGKLGGIEDWAVRYAIKKFKEEQGNG